MSEGANDARRVWEWDAEGAWKPRHDAIASAEGLSYASEIKGPCCGYDSLGSQSWDEFLTAGPPARVQMPASIAAEIRDWALARRRA